LNNCFSGFALLLFVATAHTMLPGAQGKSQVKPVVKPGVVSGRVFLITVGGDIKPARMASVYLMYTYRSVKFAEAHKEDQDSASVEWLEQYNKVREEEMAASGYYSDSKAVSCYRSLMDYSTAPNKTLDWVSANKKEWQLIAGDADEEGNFRISVPHPGDYSLYIRGHAGFSKAVWEASPVTVSPGVETKVKLASPEVACVETGD
jgi:hypothetical protein